MAAGCDEYVWITRWEEFQHYAPRRDRGPAWIKDHTAQLDDERYLDLTDRQRALLGDIRRVFAMTRGRLSRDTRTISRHRHAQTRDADLVALNHAGFIEFVSREALDHRLEKFYASRAPARSQEAEAEAEEDLAKGRTEARPPAPARPDTNGLPFNIESKITALIAYAAPDSDERTPAIIRSKAAGLPEVSLAKILEMVQRVKPRDKAAYVVGALLHEHDELEP